MDNLDASQFLPKDTPPVNAFRAQHGGVVWEGQAIRAITWLPEILAKRLNELGRPLLTEDHLHTCKSFERCVISTRQVLGITDLRIHIGNVAQSQSKPHDVFFKVMTELLPYQANLCLWVVCDEYNRANIPLAEKMITSIQQSLELAQKIIDDCRQNAKMDNVASPEVSLNSPRPE